MKILPTDKSPDLDGLRGECNQALKQGSVPIHLKLFQRTELKRMDPDSFCEASITFIPKPKQTKKKHYKNKNYKQLS